MRFRLRTLLVVFLLLCASAPWWAWWGAIYRAAKDWASPQTVAPVTKPTLIRQHNEPPSFTLEQREKMKKAMQEMVARKSEIESAANHDASGVPQN